MSNPEPDHEPLAVDFNVRLRVQPGQVPAIIRLRSFLKTALRAWSIKAVTITQVPAEGALASGPEGEGQ